MPLTRLKQVVKFIQTMRNIDLPGPCLGKIGQKGKDKGEGLLSSVLRASVQEANEQADRTHGLYRGLRVEQLCNNAILPPSQVPGN